MSKKSVFRDTDSTYENPERAKTSKNLKLPRRRFNGYIYSHILDKCTEIAHSRGGRFGGSGMGVVLNEILSNWYDNTYTK